MTKIERDDIQIISQHSNWSEKSIDKILKQQIYSTKESWQKFLKLFFISLGISFTTAGIIFFFAYNWADLHKFIKIGVIECLVVMTTLIVLFSKTSLTIKNALLTGASILVGVLFAVFGQIYQTGANAYDFFLGWTLFITLWVVISNFVPLWLVYIILINTTLVFYFQQVAYCPEIYLYTLFSVINLIFLISCLLVKKNFKGIRPPIWFTNLIALASVTLGTIGIVRGIFEHRKILTHGDYLTPIMLEIVAFTAIIYGTGIMYGLKVKSGFYLALISFSVIVSISTFIISYIDFNTIFDNVSLFLALSLFVIVSVTITIITLNNLQRKWKN